MFEVLLLNAKINIKNMYTSNFQTSKKKKAEKSHLHCPQLR